MRPKHLSRRKIVAGNWKMNGDRAFATFYLDRFQENLNRLGFKSQDEISLLLIPPAVFLSEMNVHLAAGNASHIQLAAQNVAAFESGAYTGELSASMLKDFATWCLLGHSERRSLFAESDELVVAKVARLLEVNIKPILCLGETLEEREQGLAEKRVRAQLDAVLNAFSVAQLSELVVAYEPVWAIGTGKTATPAQAQAMHAYIRGVLAEKSAELAERTPILYGGSVNAENAGELFQQDDIDGALVGGASLKADEFASICYQCQSLI